MNKLRVHIGEIEKKSVSTQTDIVEVIPHTLDEMVNSMKAFMASWEGTARDAYAINMKQYMDELFDVYTEMTTFTANIHNAAKKYEAVEKDIIQDIDFTIV